MSVESLVKKYGLEHNESKLKEATQELYKDGDTDKVTIEEFTGVLFKGDKYYLIACFHCVQARIF